MDNDTPISDEAEDKLGFMSMACQLASALAQNDFPRGFVIGVEGSWGSGKSSLVNLALERLERMDGGPVVIRFSPWIVGNRNELLQQLFSDFMPVVTNLLPESERSEVSSLLSLYSKAASPLASVAEAASATGFTWALPVARFLNWSGKKVSERDWSLSDLNEDLHQKLKKLERPIIVFIDDIDRLEPDEAVEVLRLVRAVADFPKVVYLLAYDAKALVRNIKRAIGVPDGTAYLEKIVQASFRVPMPVVYDLRSWLGEEIHKIFPTSGMSDSARDRLSQSVHIWCNEYISTPRDVIRALNAIKLYVVPQANDIDLSDAVFLQIVRIRNPQLYTWIEEYVEGLSTLGDLTDHGSQWLIEYAWSHSALEDWGKIDPGVAESMGKRLLKSIGEDEEGKTRLIYQLRQHLPGFDTPSLHEEGVNFKVYSLVSSTELQQYAVERRLASPYHFRLYFSFSVPDGMLSDSEVTTFLDLCVNNEKEAADRFWKLSSTDRPQGGKMGAVLLDRLVEQGARLSCEKIEKLMMVLGNSIDELARQADTESGYGYADFLRGEKHQIFGLIDCLEESQRQDTLKHLFRDASSLAWLSGIIRSSMIQRGYYDHGQEQEKDWLLTADEFETVRTIFLERIRSTDPTILINTPYLLSLLHTWGQASDQEDVKVWVRNRSSTNHEFTELLSNMKSWSNSSDTGVEYTVKPHTLETFFSGTQNVEHRLTGIVEAPILQRRFDDRQRSCLRISREASGERFS